MGAGAPLILRPLSTWESDLGLVAGGKLPGLTVGPLRYRLAASAAAAAADICWGFIVENEMVTTVADFDPKIRQHLSWMEYGRGVFNLIGVGAPVQLLGNGDDGFRTTRARRKIPEIEDDLMFVVSSDIAVSLIVDTSTTVLLP